MNSLEHGLVSESSQIDREAITDLSRPTRVALDVLRGLQGGTLALELPDAAAVRLGRGPLVAHWRIHDPAVFEAVLARGDIGLAETWMEGAWDSDRLVDLLNLLASNRRELGRALYGHTWRVLGYRLAHLLRANTRRGARCNVEAHYDLGNDFYALWLDASMTYSAALFESDDETLESAQRRKYRRILERLDARPGQRILEIGCGWGGFAEVAATEFDCRVVGLTLSPAQLQWARERARRGGWSRLAEFALCDYRDVRGQYDHIVSIEMIEAVGKSYWPVYFRQLAALLRPGGRCVLQAITIADELFGRYLRGTDFIQQYVFPGGMLPSPRALRQESRKAGLEVLGDLAFGAHYARTLRHWHDKFLTVAGEVRAQGFPERFLRMWRFYLAYCEAGFHSGSIDVHHVELAHAGGRR